MAAAIPADRWLFVLGELSRVTRLGGWIELTEMGTTVHQAGPATTQCLDWWTAICATRGIDAGAGAHIDAFLQHAGLTHVGSKTEIVPVGRWGGRFGTLLAHDLLASWTTMRASVQTLFQVPPQQFDAVIGDLKEEWNTLQTHYELYFASGQVEGGA
jgi:hypothetical protein